jgi:hypothetical protein
MVSLINRSCIYQIFIVIALLLITVPLLLNAQATCHQIVNPAVPQDSYFSVPYNLLSAGKELFLSGTCSSNSVNVTIGGSPTETVVYKTGYELVGGAWRPFTFSGSPYGGTTNWLSGQGTASLSRTSSELSADNYVIGQACTLSSGNWKCGCSDSSCSQSKWQLQVFSAGGGGATTLPTVTISASPSSISTTESSILNWSSTNATSCTTSDEFAGWNSALINGKTSGSHVVAPNFTRTFSVTCSGAGGNITKTAVVTVATAEACKVPKMMLAVQDRPWNLVTDATMKNQTVLNHLNSLPFDGIIIHSTAISRTFHNFNFDPQKGSPNSIPVTYSTLMGELEYLRNELPSKEKFLNVFLGIPPDVFDNWNGYLNTWRNIARAANDLGWNIFFDEEQYKVTGWLHGTSKQCNGPWDRIAKANACVWPYFDDQYWRYDFSPNSGQDVDGDGVDDAFKAKYPSKTEAQYITQARVRGRQFMQTIVDEYPDVKIFIATGIVRSLPGTSDRPRDLYHALDRSIQGGFFSGMYEIVAEGGYSASITDTSARYYLRTEDEHQRDYEYRNTGFPVTDSALPIDRQVLTVAQRADWPNLMEVGQGTYHLSSVTHPGGSCPAGVDCPNGKPTINPTLMRTVAELTMNYSDEWSYFWTEFGAGGKSLDFVSPNGCSSANIACYLAWLDPIRDARVAAQFAAQARGCVY